MHVDNCCHIEMQFNLIKTLENPLDCKKIQPVHPKGFSLIKLILWLKFSAGKRQVEDMAGGQGPQGPALFQVYTVFIG